MARRILDPKLLAKIATAQRKTEKYVGESVSKLAHKRGVSSEAALVYLAKQSDIGTANYQRKPCALRSGVRLRPSRPRSELP
jgi:hypothetical protein